MIIFKINLIYIKCYHLSFRNLNSILTKNLLSKFSKLNIVGSQIVAHTQMETGDGPNKPNTINL